MAQIHSICYSPTRTTNKPPYHYTRVPAEQVTLIENFGIEGDVKAKRSSKRQLNIMGLEMVTALGAEGYKAGIGELGEQITLSGVDIEALPAGTILKLGAEAEVKIIELRTGCDWFEKIHQLPRATGRLGVMAVVAKGGQIRVGDPVTVLVPQES